MADEKTMKAPFGSEFLVETPLYTLGANPPKYGSGGPTNNNPQTTYCATDGGDNSTYDTSDGTWDKPIYPC